MKQILGYIKTNYKEDFNLKTWAWVFIFALSAFLLNYHFEFANTYLNSQYGNPWVIVYFIGFFTPAFYIPCLIIHLTHPQLNFFRQKEFWYKSMFIIVLLAFNTGTYQHRQLLTSNVLLEWYHFIDSLVDNIGSSLIFLIPIATYWYKVDAKEPGFYGLFRRISNIRVYLLLLAACAPMIFICSYREDFLNTYPQYSAISETTSIVLLDWIKTLVAQFFYILDFATVELFFRGFTVMIMLKFMGAKSLLPMVCLYLFIHFAKPAPEAIGSFFGGYILGVLSYYSRSIWGGIIVHAGVAFLMEWAAILQKI